MIERLYSWYGKRVVRGVSAVVVILLITGSIFTFAFNDQEAAPEDTAPRSVVAKPAGLLANAHTFSYIGTARAVHEAFVESEVGGRVTSVRVSLGDRISKGAIIAELENARERAQVLQAQGAYEAAQAGADQSDVSLQDAQTSLASARQSGIDTYREAYVIAEDAIYNLVDELISNPFSQIPGIRIDPRGEGDTLAETRIEIQTLLEAWKETVLKTNLEGDSAIALLQSARADTAIISQYVDRFAELVARQDVNSEFSESDLVSLKTRFFSTRQTLQNTLASIQNDINTIENARGALARAEIGSTAGATSAANASVKQALGSLRLAQAQLEQKILRAPIDGVINTLEVRVGDFLGARAPVAMITNTNALEIIVFIDDADREKIAVGTEVRINDIAEGRISAIAPSINPNTGKVEVRIVTDSTDITTGETVRVTRTDTTLEEETELFIPITAIKFGADETFVFSINDTSNTLEAQNVTLGETRGDQVRIESGITAETVIVADARGLRDGMPVRITE